MMQSENSTGALTRKDMSFVGPSRPVSSDEQYLNEIHSSQSVDSENGHSTPNSVIATVVDSLRRATSLAELIRLSGAVLIIISLSLFLMQGVDATNDLQRYHLLLLQTSLLGTAGFAVGYLLKEPRGARVFFSLGLISIPANLAVLGAMVYSIMPYGNLSAHYPDYASWQASSLSEITRAIVRGFIVIVPMSLFAFSVLARQSRVWLTCGYLFASSMLLLPIRGSLSMTVISSVVALCMVVLIRNRRSARATILTVEERFSQILLFLPPMLMLARSAVLYSGDFHFTLALVLAAYVLLRQWSGHWRRNSIWSNSLHLVTALTATLLSGLLSTLAASNGFLPGATLVFILILGGLLLDLSRIVASCSLRWWIHTGWALLCIPALAGNYLVLTGASSFVFNLLLATLMIGSGLAFRNRLVTFLGVVSIAGIVLMQGSQVVRILLDSNWMTVAMVGAAAVVSGSLIERHGVVMKLKMQAFAERWNVQDRDSATQAGIDGSVADLPEDSADSLVA